MQTTDYEDVLKETAEACSLDPENLSTEEFSSLRRYHRKRLKIAWEHHYWPDLGRCEQRFYRPAWNDALTYGQKDEVYYGPTDKYYQSLTIGNVGNPPADGNGVVDPTYWAVCETTHNALDYDAGVLYVQGDQAKYAGVVYQLFAASDQGVLPTDNTQWCELVDFDRYVGWEQDGETAIGIVAAVWKGNPRTNTAGAEELNWTLSENGIQISTPSTFCWVEYRVRCPVLKGEPWVAGAFAVGDQVYYDTGVPGNFYDCAVTVTTQAPTDANYWAKVELPLAFHDYLVHGAAADWLNGPGADKETAAAEFGLAEAALERQRYLLTAQQSQRTRTAVQTR